jgi:hypothetical protein
VGTDLVPVLNLSLEDLEWFDLAPEARDLLARVDGVSALDTLCARAAIPPALGAALLLDLAEQGIVSFL